MDYVAIVTAVIAAFGAAAALLKGRAESRSLAVEAAGDALSMLRGTYDDRVSALEVELAIQRGRRYELQEKVALLTFRIGRLEEWIVQAGGDPSKINGGDGVAGVPI